MLIGGAPPQQLSRPITRLFTRSCRNKAAALFPQFAYRSPAYVNKHNNAIRANSVRFNCFEIVACSRARADFVSLNSCTRSKSHSNGRKHVDEEDRGDLKSARTTIVSLTLYMRRRMSPLSQQLFFRSSLVALAVQTGASENAR